MANLNRAQVIGNLTADPEIKQTKSGQTVASFSVATNRVWKDSNGEKQTASEFHNIVVWGKLAEIVEQYLEKGKQVFVEGRMQTRSWEADDGSKRYKTEIVAEQMQMLGSTGKKSDDYDDEYERRPAKKSSKKPAKKSYDDGIDPDDIPF